MKVCLFVCLFLMNDEAQQKIRGQTIDKTITKPEDLVSQEVVKG